MTATIPKPVLEADLALHQILREVAFSRYLNPTNGREVRAQFKKEGGQPVFSYLPFEEADQVLRRLDRMPRLPDHPAGDLVGSCLFAARRLTLALRDRTPEAFDALNVGADWYPAPPDLEVELEAAPAADPQHGSVSSDEIVAAFETALHDRGLTHWRVERDTVMTARVLVDSAKHLLRVHPGARFRPRDLTRLVVHEIDVHATRGANGTHQALCCFQTGLPGSLMTEEGLALVAEEEAGVSSPGVLPRQLEVLRAVDHARNAGFLEVYQALRERVSDALAWGITMRIKRGLKDPMQPGVYAKDTVYLRGRMKVRRYLDAGGPIKDLYVGKVGIDDPIAEWRKQGWVVDAPVPSIWTTRPG